MSVRRWHMRVYGNRCLKRLSFSFHINNEFWPTPTYKQAASQKITRVLVVWNSRGCFPIEILLLVAVSFPGSPIKTYLAQSSLQFGICVLPLWHYSERGQRMYWNQLNSIHLFCPYYIFPKCASYYISPKDITITSLPTCSQLGEITFYSEPSEHCIYTFLITFDLNYRYLWTELNYSTNLFLYFPHPRSTSWIWQVLGFYMWMDGWVNKEFNLLGLPNIFFLHPQYWESWNLVKGRGREYNDDDNDEDEDHHCQ